jgi:arabinan endo-1,5-alpha-L-arabinosidase
MEDLMPRTVVEAALARQTSGRLIQLLLAAVLLLSSLLVSGSAPATVLSAQGRTYQNPLLATAGGDDLVESCADPSTIYAEDGFWYTYCTTDPLNSEDRIVGGGFNFRKIPTLRSADLVNWTYVNDAFAVPPPAWAEPSAGMWAPEIDLIDGTYYLFYGVTNVKDHVSGEPGCDSDNAIGYATSASPTGPWVDSGGPLIEPRRAGAGCNFFWTYDPEVIQDTAGDYHIYFGSYYGGIWVRDLVWANDGTLDAPPASSVQVTIANRYEGAEVIHRDGYYYLFVSATDCCRGPLTGYSVFVGRSKSPEGPFVDQTGASLMASRVGGTPVLSMNGNRWVGPGHNSVFIDFDGQWWTTYHAIDRNDPYFANTSDFTKRPLLLDPVDWKHGWPQVRGGRWASDEPMPAPAAQPGEKTKYRASWAKWDKPAAKIKALSDEFNGTSLDRRRWTWVRERPDDYQVRNGVLRFETQNADLHEASNNASVLTEKAPKGDYIVETKLKLTVPADGCCFNYRQGGLVIYGNDDSYIKAVHFSYWETRQTEFAKEVPTGQPVRRYGNTVAGPPGTWTWLRIVKKTVDGEEEYRIYTSDDGKDWVRGGVWTHNLGPNARIGLVSMGGDGYVTEFDYVRVYKLGQTGDWD